MSALGGKAVAEVGLIFGIDINGKSQTKPNSSRLVGHVHPPFRARLQIWVKVADELTASCYRLLPRGGVIGKVDAFIGRPDTRPLGDMEEKSRHAALETAFLVQSLGSKQVPHRKEPRLGAEFNVRFPT